MNITEKMITTLKGFKEMCTSHNANGCSDCVYEDSTENVWECLSCYLKVHADKEVYPRLMPMVEEINRDCDKVYDSNCNVCPYRIEGVTLMCCITQGIKIKYGMDLSEHLLDWYDTAQYKNDEEYSEYQHRLRMEEDSNE